MSISSWEQKCPDECRVCAGRDYINAAVLDEAEENARMSGEDYPGIFPCPERPHLREAELELTIVILTEALREIKDKWGSV